MNGNGSTDVAWFGAHGHQLSPQEWESGGTYTLAMLLDGDWIGSTSLLLLLHGGVREQVVTLPGNHSAQHYSLLWDSTWETPRVPDDTVPLSPGTDITMAATSMRIYRLDELAL